MDNDFALRLNTQTGEFTEYLLPHRTNVRHVEVQKSGAFSILWLGDQHGNTIVRAEVDDAGSAPARALDPQTILVREACMINCALAFVLSLVFCLSAHAQERMPPIPAEKMSEAQKKAAAEYIAARGPLTGPWNVLLRSPEIVNRARAVSDYLRFNSAFPPRLSELIILITARQWTQQYVWNAHYAAALKGGLHADIAKAVAEGRRPHRWPTTRKPCTTSASSCTATTA